MATIDHKALALVEEDLEKGAALTFSHVGNVFGSTFWELLVMSLMDANDAARAIQNAVNRLRMGDNEDIDDDDDSYDE